MTLMPSVKLSALSPLSTLKHADTTYIVVNGRYNHNGYARDFILLPVYSIGSQLTQHRAETTEIVFSDRGLLTAIGLDPKIKYAVDVNHRTSFNELFPSYGLRDAKADENRALNTTIHILGAVKDHEYKALKGIIIRKYTNRYGTNEADTRNTDELILQGKKPPPQYNSIPLRPNTRAIAPETATIDPIIIEPPAETVENPLVDEVVTEAVAPSPAPDVPTGSSPIKSFEGLAELLAQMQSQMPQATKELMTEVLSDYFKRAANNGVHSQTTLFLQGVLTKGFELKAKAVNNNSPFDLKLQDITPTTLIDICQKIVDEDIPVSQLISDLYMIGKVSANIIKDELPAVIQELRQRMTFG